MSPWWLVLAFIGGMAFMWKLGGRLLWYALGKRSLLFEESLGKLDYDALIRMRHVVDREIVKRVPPSNTLLLPAESAESDARTQA